MPLTGTLEEVLQDLKGELGRDPYEVPAGSNRTKYGQLYGMDGYAWCAMFVWVVLALWNKIDHPKSAYTPTVFEWYRSRKRTSRTARVGALVFFNFFDSLDRIQHIGFVVQVGNGWIETIEGNTSSTAAGSQDNGGGVYKRRRVTDSQIVGYAYPFYLKAPEKVELDFPIRAWFGKGDKGADVKNWQRDLNGYFKAKGYEKPLEPITNVFDDRVVKYTKQFQHEQGLDVDGRVGKHTLEKMERIRDRQEDR
jgi:hypothetical protein